MRCSPPYFLLGSQHFASHTGCINSERISGISFTQLTEFIQPDYNKSLKTITIITEVVTSEFKILVQYCSSELDCFFKRRLYEHACLIYSIRDINLKYFAFGSLSLIYQTDEILTKN